MLDDVQELLDQHRDRARQTLAGLPQAALDWSSAELPNSLAVLACHIAGSERFWIGDVALGESSGRDRPAEFRARGLAEAELVARLDAVRRYSADAFRRLKDVDPDRRCPVPEHEGHAVSVRWAVLHALEHTAYHAGQMVILRKAWLASNAAAAAARPV